MFFSYFDDSNCLGQGENRGIYCRSVFKFFRVGLSREFVNDVVVILFYKIYLVIFSNFFEISETAEIYLAHITHKYAPRVQYYYYYFLNFFFDRRIQF